MAVMDYPDAKEPFDISKLVEVILCEQTGPKGLICLTVGGVVDDADVVNKEEDN